MPETGVPGGTWLGFDFGLRRIGIAVGQTETRTANPLAVVSNGDRVDWESITRILEEWKPAGLVVGLPLSKEAGETEMSARVRRFAAALERRSGCRVLFADERLTSVAAESRFVQARSEGRARRKAGRHLDAMAASIILENWLQSTAPPVKKSTPQTGRPHT